MTAEHDPLRDEGEAYAERLREDGVPVAVERWDGMVHGFLRRLAQVESSRRLVERLAEVAREAEPTSGD